MALTRHNTATGLVFHEDRVLLIEHAKLKWWMPPGGHVDENEDPVQAVLREVREETGLECEIVAEQRFTDATNTVQVLPPPFTILVENVPERGTTVQHIDFIYVLRPVSDPAMIVGQEEEVTGVRWVPVQEVDKLAVPTELPELLRAAANTVPASRA